MTYGQGGKYIVGGDGIPYGPFPAPTPPITCIIPAWNEEDTVGPVVEAFLWCRYVRPIIVSVDGWTEDDTAVIAGAHLKGEHNGTVLRNPRIVHGKGQTLMAALAQVRTPYVFFCDADISGLEPDHISIMISDATTDETSLTIGVPDIPDNYPEDREWAWPWVSGIRCMPMRVIRPLQLHGYLTEVQINSVFYHSQISIRMERLFGVKSPYQMSERRLEDMEKDAAWGHQHGILP